MMISFVRFYSGKCVTDDDLIAIATTELGSARETPIVIKGLSLSSGAIVSPTATVKLEIDGVEKETASTGVGPVDAALNAIRNLIQDSIDVELEEWKLLQAVLMHWLKFSLSVQILMAINQLDGQQTRI